MEHVEIDLKVAEKIMKWKVHKDDDGDVISLMTHKDKLLFFCDDPSERDWKPSLALEQAMEVIELLRKKDLFIDIKCDVDGYFLSYYKDGTHYELKRRFQLGDLPKEICLTALEAIKPQRKSKMVTYMYIQ